MPPEWNSARATIGVANQLSTYDDQIQEVEKIYSQPQRHLQMFHEPIWGQYSSLSQTMCRVSWSNTQIKEVGTDMSMLTGSIKPFRPTSAPDTNLSNWGRYSLISLIEIHLKMECLLVRNLGAGTSVFWCLRCDQMDGCLCSLMGELAVTRRASFWYCWWKGFRVFKVCADVRNFFDEKIPHILYLIFMNPCKGWWFGLKRCAEEAPDVFLVFVL